MIFPPPPPPVLESLLAAFSSGLSIFPVIKGVLRYFLISGADCKVLSSNGLLQQLTGAKYCCQWSSPPPCAWRWRPTWLVRKRDSAENRLCWMEGYSFKRKLIVRLSLLIWATKVNMDPLLFVGRGLTSEKCSPDLVDWPNLQTWMTFWISSGYTTSNCMEKDCLF